jgi:ribosome-binding factor A
MASHLPKQDRESTIMASKGPSQRQLRVGELVRHALTQVLQREAMPVRDLDTSRVTVSEVRMSPDLKIATCFVSLLNGSPQDVKAALDGLERSAKFLRGRAAPLLQQMKYMPTFRFREDTSFANFARIDALLRSDAVTRDLDPEEHED